MMRFKLQKKKLLNKQRYTGLFWQKSKPKTHIQVACVQLHLLLQLSQQLVVEGLQLEKERRISGDIIHAILH